MEQFRNMIREDREKLREKSVSDVIWYIYTYYRVQIFLLVTVLAVGGYLLFLQLTVPKETWFYACLANTFQDPAPIAREYAAYAGYDLSQKRLVINAQIYCNPSGYVGGNKYYESLVTLMDSGAMDVIVMDKEDVAALGRSGRLLDLSSSKGEGLAERWESRLLRVVPDNDEYGTEPLPVGIDLTGSRLVGDYRAYAGNVFLGVNAEATHIDQVEVFLQYLFQGE